MKHKWKGLSFLLVFALLLQLLLPISGVFAASLAAPTSVTYKMVTPSDVQLSWPAVTGAGGYKIYLLNGGSQTMVSTTPVTTRIIGNLAQGQYTYAVAATSGTTESPLSNPVTVTIAYPQMPAPANFSYTVANGSDINLKWDAVPYAQSYNLSEIVNGTKKPIGTLSTTSKTISNASEGTHTYVVTSVNPLYGESSPTTPLDVSVSYPTLLPPTNLTSSIGNGNDVTLRWTEAAYASQYKVYDVTSGTRVSLGYSLAGIKAVANVSEGTHVYEVTTYSDRFGESKTAAQITVNVAWPVIQPPTNLASTIQNGNDVKLTWNAAGYASSYNVYQIIGGERKLATNIAATSKTFVNLPEGNYSYEVTTVTDRFGESKTASSSSATVVYPVMQPPTAPKFSTFNGNDVALNWTAADYALGYKVYEIIDGKRVFVMNTYAVNAILNNVAAGPHTYEVTAFSDRFGESQNGLEIKGQVVFPTMQPPVTFTAKVSNGNDVAFTWTQAEFATMYKVYQVTPTGNQLAFKSNTLNNSLTRLPKATYVYEIHSYSDRYGESPKGTQVTVVVEYPDMKPPALTLQMTSYNSAKLNWGGALYAESYNIYRLVNGAGTLVGNTANLYYALSNLNTKENYDFVVTSVNSRYGESPYSNAASVKFDTEAPHSATNLIDRWYSADVKVTINANDNAAGVDKIYYALNDGVYVEGTSLTIADPGVSKLSYYAVDKAGNTETPHTVDVKVDKTAPVTKSDYQGADVLTDKITLTPTDDLSGVVETRFSINDGAFQIGTVIPITPSVTKVVYYSVDRAGNEEAKTTLTFNGDANAPVTSSNITSDWRNTDFEVMLTATDDYSGVDKTLYTLNGTDALTGSRFTVSKEGRNKVTFYSVDKAGNKETAQAATINIDKTAPVTTSNAEAGWVTSRYTFELSANDPLSGVANTYYSLDGADFEAATSFKPAEGVHQITFYSVDNVGNKENANSAQIQVDRTAPTTTFEQAGNVVKLSATDTLSGVAGTYYNLNGGTPVQGSEVTLPTDAASVELTFYSVDNAGNREESHTVSVQLDVTPPVTRTSLSDEWYNDDIDVAFGATDDLSGVDKTYYSLDGGMPINDWSFAVGSTLLISEEGEHTLTYYSVDKAGNKEEPKTSTAKLDKTKPVTTSNLDAAYVKPGFEVQLAATDDRSGVDKTFYKINGLPVQEGTSFVLNASGSYTISYYSVDKAKNEETKHVFEIVVDTTAPVTASNLQNNWYNIDVAAKLMAKDDLSGVNKTFYTVDGSLDKEGTDFSITEEGTHTVTYYSVDKVGNTEEPHTATVKVDKTAPVTASNLSGNYVKLGAVVKLTATDNLSGVAGTYVTVNGVQQEGSEFTIDKPGVYTIIFYSVDQAGNKEEPTVLTVTADITPPVTVSDITGEWNSSDVAVHLTATDDQSGVDKTFYSVDDKPFVEGTVLDITEPGIHKVTFYSVDKAGNVESQNTAQVKIDKQAPVTTSDAKDGWYNSKSSLKLSATDDLSGVKTTYYSVDDGEFTEGTAPQLTEPGLHKVTFYSVDNAGNKEEAKSIEIKIDEVAPVTVSDIKDGWNAKDVTVNLTATDDLSGVDKTFYSVDGATMTEGNTVVITEPGIHKVVFYSVDKAGNVEQAKSAEVKIDEQPPVTVSNIQNGWSKTDGAVSLKATDDLSGVDKTYYTVDGGAKQTGTTFNVTGEGIHKVTFYSVDKAGNVEATNSAEVKIDKTAPVVSLNSLDSEIAMGSQIKLSYTATDNLSGIDSEVMTVNGKPVANNSTITLDSSGEYVIKVTVTDRAGWTTTIEKKFVSFINATMDVTPTVITPNTGVITVRLTMPKGFSYNFDLSTVKVNGASAITDKGAQSWVKQGMFKFNRDEINWTSSQMTLVFRGYCDGKLVIAQKTVKVNLK